MTAPNQTHTVNPQNAARLSPSRTPEAHQKTGGEKTRLKRDELAQEALKNAVTSESFANYKTIIEGFIERGIPAQEIVPRENVFTFNAWRALGRTVKKGEKGVAVLTWIECKAKDNEQEKPKEEQGEGGSYKRAKTTYVFHISQTQPIETTTAKN